MFLAHANHYHWQLDWTTFLPILFLVSVYILGTYRLYQRRRMNWHGTIAFAAVIIFLLIATISPLHQLSHDLFAAHMAQHLIFLVIVPLLVLQSGTFLPLLWGLPKSVRKAMIRLMRVTHSPPLTWGMHTIVVWVWHLPALYNVAVESPFIHWLEHITFLGAALLYWRVLMYPPRLNYGISVFSAFFTMMQGSILGLLMTFAGQAWYSVHRGVLGYTALEDQQLAGVLMWLPAGIVYLVVALILLNKWLQHIDQQHLLLKYFEAEN